MPAVLSRNFDNFAQAAKIDSALANNCHESGIHGQILYNIGPNNGLDPAEGGVDAAYDAHDQNSCLHVHIANLIDCQGWGVYHYKELKKSKRGRFTYSGINDGVECINNA